MSWTALLRRAATFGRGVVTGMPADAERRDPIDLFGEWYRSAQRAGLFEPNAMTLATASPDGRPSARIVLLKDYDPAGFVFYTNYGSRKAGELEANPQAALIFHWATLMRQVRIEGQVTRTSEEESQAYFGSRPRGSRIGAWASRQSAPLTQRGELEARVDRYEREFRDREVALPPFWGGYRLEPRVIEFWQGRASRLHDRVRFERGPDGWVTSRLYP